ncbi:putative NAD(P)-binding domain-containing protein [Seiridium cardinale]|uniref:NAD(P)-binding domain-containing protein n=1 Tax=Seiridium cardinale TaxID=138064 RepID=A0ABR2XWA6_9PEZI
MIHVFATGITGYVGGDAIFAIVTAHPEYTVSCLIRDKEREAAVSKKHPNIKLVYGDLDDAELLEAEASKADIVCHFADATHEPSVKALIRGLARRDASQSSYFIHTTISGILLYHDVVNGKYGESSDNVYDDLDGLSEVIDLPDFSGARRAEIATRNAGVEHGTHIKTAIVCLSTVYGIGRGVRSYRSVSIHELARSTLVKGHGIQVNNGKAAWGHIYIRDLSNIYLKLVENAANSSKESATETQVGPAVWGVDGFYFGENGEHVWGEAAQWIATEAMAQGFLQSDVVKSVSPTEAGELTPRAQFLWGCNSRPRAKRARQLLNWQPEGPPLRQEISGIVTAEAVKLGLTKP